MRWSGTRWYLAASGTGRGGLRPLGLRVLVAVAMSVADLIALAILVVMIVLGILYLGRKP